MVAEEIEAVGKLVDALIEFCVAYGFQVLGAVVVLALGVAAGSWIAKRVQALMTARNIDITLARFAANAVKTLVITFAVIIALGKFGITIAPFIAALGAAAFGASFALQGPLANYGAGLVIVITRPFTVGNTIRVAGVSGVVEEVRLSCTLLTDEVGETITIPNKSIIGEILHNSRENKIVQGLIGISYHSDPEKVIQVIRKVLADTPDVNREKDPIVGIQGFGDSAVDIGFRYWVPTAKYYTTAYGVNLAVYRALQDQGVEIPFPQREVRILDNTTMAGEAKPDNLRHR